MKPKRTAMQLALHGSAVEGERIAMWCSVVSVVLK